jgi:hypothetical protein
MRQNTTILCSKPPPFSASKAKDGMFSRLFLKRFGGASWRGGGVLGVVAAVGNKG